MINGDDIHWSEMFDIESCTPVFRALPVLQTTCLDQNRYDMTGVHTGRARV